MRKHYGKKLKKIQVNKKPSRVCCVYVPLKVYVEALSPSLAVFGGGPSKEVIKVKWGHKGGPSSCSNSVFFFLVISLGSRQWKCQILTTGQGTPRRRVFMRRESREPSPPPPSLSLSLLSFSLCLSISLPQRLCTHLLRKDRVEITVRRRPLTTQRASPHQELSRAACWFGLQPPELWENKFLLFKPWVYGTLLWQLRLTNIAFMYQKI